MSLMQGVTGESGWGICKEQGLKGGKVLVENVQRNSL